MKEEKGTTDENRAAEPRTRVEKDAGAKQPEAAPKKPKYEFKILPVDPKNTFDFEDVADK